MHGSDYALHPLYSLNHVNSISFCIVMTLDNIYIEISHELICEHINVNVCFVRMIILVNQHLHSVLVAAAAQSARHSTYLK